VKAATTAVEAATAAVEASTAAAVEAAAATAMGACLCRVCEQEPCDRAREDRGARHQ
jgi:predicted transcriptional regulator